MVIMETFEAGRADAISSGSRPLASAEDEDEDAESDDDEPAVVREPDE
jgi:hypothetical protein